MIKSVFQWIRIHFVASAILVLLSLLGFTLILEKKNDNLLQNKFLNANLASSSVDSSSTQAFKNWETALYSDYISNLATTSESVGNSTLDSLQRAEKNGQNLTASLLNFELQKYGISFIDPSNTADISSDLAANASQLRASRPTFQDQFVSDSSINISSDSSVTAVKNYFNKTAQIYSKMENSLPANDVDIIAQALQNQDSSILKEIDPIKESISNAAGQISNVAVPKKLLTFDKKLIWYLDITANQMNLMEKIDLSDPVFISLIINLRYETLLDLSSLIHTDIPQWFKENNIIFLNSEPAGKLFISQ